MLRTRTIFSGLFCRGRGVEIGALHHPFPMPEYANIRYIDRMSVEELRIQYPELKNEALVPVDIIEDGESLQSLPDGCEDFLVASQFLEHCQNPIRAIVNMLRVVKHNGYVILTIPDKRVTFDKERAITTNEHLMDECLHGAEKNRKEHFREFARAVGGNQEDQKVEEYANILMERNYSIHYHVWDPDSFIKFLLFFKENFKLPVEIFATFLNKEELIVVLQKVRPTALSAI
jgi:SAM-dependent methyltransferase